MKSLNLPFRESEVSLSCTTKTARPLPESHETSQRMTPYLSKVNYTGRFIMFSVITNIYNKKTKGPTLMELFTSTGKLKKFLTTREVRCVHHG
jgi:hypothetical protein